jgi:hypothetical protein
LLDLALIRNQSFFGLASNSVSRFLAWNENEMRLFEQVIKKVVLLECLVSVSLLFDCFLAIESRLYFNL